MQEDPGNTVTMVASDVEQDHSPFGTLKSAVLFNRETFGLNSLATQSGFTVGREFRTCGLY